MLILGTTSYTQANSPRLSAPQRGFTLIELLVVIAIVGMIAALLFPVFLKARQRAQSATCLSNLRQIGLAVRAYQNDYEGDLPPFNPYGAHFSDATYTDSGPRDPLAPYGSIGKLYHCPEAPNPWQPPASEYGTYCTRFDFYFTEAGSPSTSPEFLWRLQPEPDTVIMYCPAEVFGVANCQDATIIPHGPSEMFQALRGDGSVKRVPASQVQFRQWDIAPFAGKYVPAPGDQSGPYGQFPGEPWPPKLTPVGKEL